MRTTTCSPNPNVIKFSHWGKPIKILRKSVGAWDVIKVPSIGNWSAILGNGATVLSKHINLLLNDTWVAIVVEFLWRIGSWSNLWFAETGIRNKSAYGWWNKKNQGQSRVDLSVYLEGYVPSRRSLHSPALKEKMQKTLRQSEPQRNDFKPGFD